MNTGSYSKTVQDELDWKLLDELHSAVSQFSSFCFEIKKFCVTTEFIAIGLVAKFSGDKISNYMFVSALLIPLCFWFVDATSYFYQVKLRGTMQLIRERIAMRASAQLESAQETQVISTQRSKAPLHQRVFNSVFNHSMWIYVLLISIDVVIWIYWSTKGVL